MVNKLSNIPFKINIPLLDYIIAKGIEQNLLIDPEVPHEYANKEKRTKHQQSSY
jgi:hypothetical protein